MKKQFQRLFLPLAILLLITSCMSNREQVLKLTSDQVASQVKISGSKFDSSQAYVSPTVNDGWTDYRLRSWKNIKTQKFSPTHQVYVVFSYGSSIRPPNTGKSWIFYSKAQAVGGQTVDVLVIKRDHDCSSSGCFFTEHIGIDLTDKFIQSKRFTGFELRVSNKNGGGAQIINFPSNIVDGHLKALESHGYKS